MKIETIDSVVQNISLKGNRTNVDNIESNFSQNISASLRLQDEIKDTIISNHSTVKQYSFHEYLRSIIYNKKSLGKNGKEINVYKFRTMIHNADTYLSHILDSETNLNHQGKLLEDPRVTTTGKFLRKFWIDELPQFYNILRGNMKWVGVRPMQEEFWSKYPKDIREKALKQKPGLFGVNYSVSKKSGVDHFEVLRNYLNDYGKHPILTDIKYFYKIWHNILTNGECSR